MEELVMEIFVMLFTEKQFMQRGSVAGTSETYLTTQWFN